jgi:hypothetical protein
MTENGGYQLSTSEKWLFSVQNAVPFLAGATFGAWLSDPLQVMRDPANQFLTFYDHGANLMQGILLWPPWGYVHCW